MHHKPRILRVEETEVGKKLASSDEERQRHRLIVGQLREANRRELEAIARSQRLTWEDLHGPTFH